MNSVHVFKQHIPVPIILLGVVEAAIFILSVFLASYLRFLNDVDIGHDLSLESIQQYTGPLFPRAFLFMLIFWFSMLSMGLYSLGSTSLRRGSIVLRIAVSHLVGLFIFAFAVYVVPSLFLGRGPLFIAALAAFVLVVLARVVFLKLVRSEVLKKNILVYGAGSRALYVANLEKELGEMGVVVSGYISVEGDKYEPALNGAKISRNGQTLLECATQYRAGEIVVAVDDRRNYMPIDELLECRLSGINVIDLPAFFERVMGKVRLDILVPSWLIFANGFDRGLFRSSVERVFDILGSSALLLLTSPVLILTAFLIKLEDGLAAPVFFKQLRIGEGGKAFEVYKFRSMCQNAEKSGKPQWATKNDSRVTKIGGFIRKTRIDEIPQTINVLRGDMSFVGPRPERPEFVTELSKKIPYYNERHRVKPGITGWAQLKYPYGSTDRDAMEKLQYDIYYTKNHSILLDLFILVQTVEVVLFGKGAR